MHISTVIISLASLLGTANALALRSNGNTFGTGSFDLRPFTIDLSNEVPRMLQQVKNTKLPQAPEYPGASAGITLDTLKSLQNQWTSHFDWEKEQRGLNK
jgi:hypothetical protein